MPPLKTERAGEKLWLMKVPSFLMEQLADAQAASEQIGSIRPDDHAPGADHPSKAYTLQLAESSRLPREMPREFSVSMSEAPAGSYVFSEPKDAAKDGSWRLEGQIDRKGEARPKSLSSEYKSLIAKRVETANLKREIQSSFEETGASRQQGSLRVTKKDRDEQASKRKKPEIKPETLTPEQIRKIIFAEFEQKPFLSRQELMQTEGLRGQKAANVNAVLTSICEHVKVGSNKGDFQLKKQFTTS